MEGNSITMNRNTNKKHSHRLFESTKYVLINLFELVVVSAIIIVGTFFITNKRPDQIGLSIITFIGSGIWLFSVITKTICEIFENEEFRIYQAKLPTFITKMFLTFLKLPKTIIKYFGIVLIFVSILILFLF